MIRDEALGLKTADVIIWCLVRAIIHLKIPLTNEYASSGGTVIGMGKVKELREKPAPSPLNPPQISHDVTCD
jgi:hypothetical protein